MSKYSDFFLLGAPEYQEIGDKLRLRKYGSWLAEEAWLREEQNKKRAQFTLQMIHLARKIAKAKSIDEDEAFRLLQSSDTNSESLLGEFADEAAQLMSVIPSSREQFEKLVTLFFRNRGEVVNGKKWQQTEDWDDEDTGKLPQVLLSSVEKFMLEEDKAVEPEEEDNIDPKDED